MSGSEESHGGGGGGESWYEDNDCNDMSVGTVVSSIRSINIIGQTGRLGNIHITPRPQNIERKERKEKKERKTKKQIIRKYKVIGIAKKYECPDGYPLVRGEPPPLLVHYKKPGDPITYHTTWAFPDIDLVLDNANCILKSDVKKYNKYIKPIKRSKKRRTKSADGVSSFTTARKMYVYAQMESKKPIPKPEEWIANREQMCLKWKKYNTYLKNTHDSKVNSFFEMATENSAFTKYMRYMNSLVNSFSEKRIEKIKRNSFIW